EHLIWLLTEELVRRGHEVTLFATGDSETSAARHTVYARGYEYDDSLWNYEFHETLHVAAAFERAQQFDVIHSHVYHLALPFTRLVQAPVVHTHHTLADRDVLAAYARYPEAQLVAVSHFQRSQWKGLATEAVVHHGIDMAAFPFNPTPGDYLLFLGWLSPGKGPVEAICLARQAGKRLLLAGP